MSFEGCCFICERSLDDGVPTRTVKQRGIKTLITKSQLRNDNKSDFLVNLSEVTVHETCRVVYLTGQKIVIEDTPPTEEIFDFEKKCFLCDKQWRPAMKAGRCVTSAELQIHILNSIDIRDDKWTDDVERRIRGRDLLKEKARYHVSCFNKFVWIPTNYEKGRPEITDLTSAIDAVCQYMENSVDCQFTLNELLNKMGEYTTSTGTLKQKLIGRYGDGIIFIEVPGKSSVVCFRSTGHKILTEQWYKSQAATESDERLRIIKAAGDIIREDIRSQLYEMSCYPSPKDLLADPAADVPESLQVLLDAIMCREKKKYRREDGQKMKKRNSIAHAIISEVRPRSFISSIQLATGVYLSRKFGSKQLIDVLHNLGFCISYNNVSLYEASAILQDEKKIENGTYVQYVFDNADHNVCSLDGFNTFHSMGGICCVTPKSGVQSRGIIKKLSSVPKSNQLASQLNIPIVCCNRLTNEKTGLKTITFSDVTQLDLGLREQLPPAYALHIWAKFLNIDSVPSWRGYMENLNHDQDYHLSHVYCLPFVNLPPSNPDTISTVLHHAHLEALRAKQSTCFGTFDQPLYIKAREIVANDKNNLQGVIVRLGGFHMLMSFLGAIGNIMDGSGLKELLADEVYAGNSVDHMLTGHAFSRAIRAHLLVYSALGTLIAEHVDIIDDERHQRIVEFLKDFHHHPPTLQEVNDNIDVIEITTNTVEIINKLVNIGRTSKLWVQYFHCITLLMQFIEAERLGNWNLHLKCVRDMLRIFHAGGHFAYAKSAQIYLQDMAGLKNRMDMQEYVKFTEEGYFTIRRSDKKWAGIWADMTVEQTLMRVMKVTGGLTHGRGINKEGVVARWILAMPVAYEVIEAFETFTGVRTESSEQHTDWRISAREQDKKHYLIFLKWLREHDPFAAEHNHQLMSLGSKQCAGDTVNCDEAVEVGVRAMESIIGVNAADVKLKRATRVKSIATVKRGITIDDEMVAVNTTLLFQRIVAVIKDDTDLATKSLHHELAPFPMALFNEQGLMRKNAKADFYKTLSSQPMTSINLSESKVIIDGGFLLHKVAWSVPTTYQQILQQYTNYVINHYGVGAIVVFDGYGESEISIKSYERIRRSMSKTSPVVIFDEKMTATIKPEIFLSNSKNKERLINFLKSHLSAAGIEVRQALEDADRLIVTSAIEQLSCHEKIVVVGQDVDLVALLIALTPAEKDIIFIKEDRKASTAFSTQQHRHLKELILFSHAFTGCDTTNAIFQKGKQSFSKILKKNKELKAHVMFFNYPNSTRDDIKQAGEHLMMALYGAQPNKKCLNDFRYEQFVNSATKFKTEVRLAQLPPTLSATEEHSYRVYFQIQKWLGNDQLNPLDWGWELQNQSYFPIRTRAPPAPELILKMIYCTCKGHCSNRCGCRKSGLKCTSICTGCQGTSCLNRREIDLLSDDSENSENSTAALVQNLDAYIYQQMDMPGPDEDAQFPEVTFDYSLERADSTVVDNWDQSSSSKRRRVD